MFLYKTDLGKNSEKQKQKLNNSQFQNNQD